MGIKKTLSKKYIAKNPICAVREDTVELDNGKITTRIVLETTPGSIVFAVTKDNEVLLVKNYSYIHNKMLWELPAGYMEKNDTPEKTARRELLEETGYEAGSFEYLGEIYDKPGRTNKISHTFLARNIKKTSKLKLDEGEKITVHKVKIDKLMKMIEKNEIKTSDALATILLALQRLKQKPL